MGFPIICGVTKCWMQLSNFYSIKCAKAFFTQLRNVFYFREDTLNLIWASLVAQRLKHLLAMQETQVRSLGWEDPCGSAAKIPPAVQEM